MFIVFYSDFEKRKDTKLRGGKVAEEGLYHLFYFCFSTEEKNRRVKRTRQGKGGTIIGRFWWQNKGENEAFRPPNFLLYVVFFLLGFKSVRSNP